MKEKGKGKSMYMNVSGTCRKKKESRGEENLGEKQKGENKCQSKLRGKGPYFPFVP